MQCIFSHAWKIKYDWKKTTCQISETFGRKASFTGNNCKPLTNTGLDFMAFFGY